MLVVVVVILVGAAFAPPVQTWIAQLVLARQTGVQGTVGGFQARFGELAVHDLNLKAGGVVLTVPLLEADLPLTKAAVSRRVHVRRLAAKGWTLDFTGAVTANPERKDLSAAPGATGGPQAFASAALGSAEVLTEFLRANLRAWTLPCDLTLDGVDLEGDVLIPAGPIGGPPRRLHLTVTGGGLAPGRDGTFTVEAIGSVIGGEFANLSLVAQGQATLTLATARTFRSVGIKADLGAGVPYPGGLTLSGEVAANATSGDGAFGLSVMRDGRALASLAARLPAASDRPAGTWALALTADDVAAVASGATLPVLAAKGQGTFEADPAFGRVHALGRLDVDADKLGLLVPSLAAAGPVALDADLDAILEGSSLRVDHLRVSLADAAVVELGRAAAPVADVRLLQAFDLDLNTGAFKPASPAADLAEGSLRRLPLAWLPAAAGDFAVAGGDIAGIVVVRLGQGGFALRSTSPLTIGRVAVRRGDRELARNLDLSASIVAENGAKGWQVELAPLALGSGGAGVGVFKGKVSLPPGPGEPAVVTGTWTADLAALAAKAVLPDLAWVRGRSAAGDLSATLGAGVDLDAKLAYVGSDPNDTIDANVHVESDGGRLLLRVPLKVAFGSGRSDATVEVTSFHDFTGNQLYLKLDGPKAALDHLKLLHDRLIAAGLLPPPSAAGVRDRTPFWGDWSGRVFVMLHQLTAGDRVFNDVAAAFDVRRGSVKFSEGRGKLGDRDLTDLAGSLTFDPAAGNPYHLTATASLEKIEATGLFPPPAPDRDPVIEGRFAIAGTLAGEGINLGDLANHVRESAKITSIAGAIRFLKTDVNEAIPHERQTAAGDALGRMGAAVGTFLGAETDIGTGKRTVGPSVQAAIDVINAVSEIAYDDASLTAVRAADGSVKLADIAVAAPDLRLTGSGEIGNVAGRALRDQPVTVDLEFWAKGRLAKLLAAAGLLSDRQDDKGYTALKDPIQLRGTLAKMDTSQWHRFLLESAQRPAAAAPAAGVKR